MIKLRAEITPDWHAVTRSPPCRQSQIQHVKHADNRSWPHPEAEQKAHSEKSFDHADQVAKKHGMRKHHAGQERPVKTHDFLGDEVPKISLESAVSKAGPSQLVFAEQ